MEKMNFESFTQLIAKHIIHWLPENFLEAKVILQKITKENDIRLTGLTIRPKEGSNVVPTIYLDSFYQEYLDGKDINAILQEIADLRLEHEVTESLDTTWIASFAECSSKIFPKLVGYEKNKALLNQRPHVLIEDLVILFIIDLGMHNNGFTSIPIDNQMMNVWEVSTEELYEVAMHNLTSANNNIFVPMKTVMAELLLPDLLNDCDGNEALAEHMLSLLVPDNIDLFVLSNKEKINGASVILDDKCMQQVIDKMGTDFYILPSSINEWLVVPAWVQDPGVLRSIVHEINGSTVDEADQLSDSVYTYSAESGLRRIA